LIVLPREEECEEPPRMKLPHEVEEFLRELRKELPPEPEDLDIAAGGEDMEMPMGAHGDMGMPMGGDGEHGGAHHPMPVRPVQFQGRQIDWEEYLHLPGVYPEVNPHKPLHVSMFLHYMAGSSTTPAFDSGPIPKNGSFEATFGPEGTFNYHCNI